MGAYTQGGSSVGPVSPDWVAAPWDLPMTRDEWEEKFLRSLRQAQRIARRLPKPVPNWSQGDWAAAIQTDIILLSQLLGKLEGEVMTGWIPEGED